MSDDDDAMPGPVDLAAVLAQISQPWEPRTVAVKGTPHQPFSPDGAEVLLVEPRATVNTGDTLSELTAERRVV